MIHFYHRIVAAGEWKRCNSQGEGMKGETNEERPHFVPRTERAANYMKAALFLGGTGLCPGLVKDGDNWILAFRFIQLPDDQEQLNRMLSDLDDEVERYTSAVA